MKIKIKHVACVLIIFCLFWVLQCNKPTENYGGPIKNVRKIPMTSCYKVCDAYTIDLCGTRPYNQYNCERINESCKLECELATVQRI